MERLKVLNLLTALSNAKKILSDIHEYDDSDFIELLELKYEKLYVEISKK